MDGDGPKGQLLASSESVAHFISRAASGLSVSNLDALKMITMILNSASSPLLVIGSIQLLYKLICLDPLNIVYMEFVGCVQACFKLTLQAIFRHCRTPTISDVGLVAWYQPTIVLMQMLDGVEWRLVYSAEFRNVVCHSVKPRGGNAEESYKYICRYGGFCSFLKTPPFLISFVRVRRQSHTAPA
jgi:hypothetical protein